MMNEFEFYQKRECSSKLILFIHGFTGNSVDTWSNKNGKNFPGLLLQDLKIKDNFDVASYNYYTTLLDQFLINTNKFNWIQRILNPKTYIKERNLDIDELARNLSSHVRFTLEQYDTIYIVAHSMGGLIAKQLIVNDLNKRNYTKVKLFISLAVPHQGAELSIIGGLISSNLQIDNINPVKAFINKLNQNWINLDSKPTTKYFYGSYDQIVSKYSAVAMDKIGKDIVSVPHDHYSISKPENMESLVCKSVLNFINNQYKEEILNKDCGGISK
ncbi:esterase/lipase family protein [Photobacterium leiognathi]|uniref:esterase/lipase family protein n=1 Tax=Photobacterium leiognathi TaxID=553611 RepID=UPI002980EFA5|nr:hypothetical protein [Photobacterium leiognathi]